VTATVAADSNDNQASSSATAFTIGKATPTVTVTVGTYTYSGSSQGPNTFTTSPTGDTGTPTWSYVGVSGTAYGPSATRPTAAGSYTAQVTALTADANFNASSSSATAFSIAKATPTVTVTVGTYTYSGSSQGPNAVTFSPAGDTGAVTWSYVGTGSTTYTASPTPPTAAGTYNATASVALDSNNNAASSSATAFSIGTAALTITATGPGKTYGTALTTGTSSANFTSSATQHGETVTSVTLTPNAAGLSATTAAGAAYTVTPSAATGGNGFSAANYNITFSPFNGTVGQATLTITAKADSKTYGQTKTYGTGLAAATYVTITGLQNSDAIDTVTITDSNSGGPASAAAGGTYNLTPSAAHFSTGSSSNYSTPTYTAGLLSVGQAPLTITAKADSKTYGQTKTYGAGLAAATYVTISGLQNSDAIIDTVTITDTDSGGPAAAAAGGTYHLTPSAAHFSAGTSGNYTIGYNTGLLSVGQATLTVTPNAVSTPYTGTALNNATYSDATANYSITGFVNSETIASSGLTLSGIMNFNGATGTVVQNAGSYALTVGTLALTANNYSMTFANPTPNAYVITAAGTTTGVTTSGSPALPGASVTFTATVSAGGPVPTGTVQFKTNGVALGSAVTVNGSGVATISSTTLTHGSLAVTALYANSDGNFSGSTGTLSPNQVIDRPPFTLTHSFGILMNTNLVITAVNLAKLDYDPDGDVLTITNVSSTSTNGPSGNVTLTGGTVTYAPANNYVGQDTFNYVVTDPFGELATNTVMVTTRLGSIATSVIYKAVPQTGGDFNVIAFGIPGRTYWMQAAPNAGGPWTNISTNVAAANGVMSFIDTAHYSSRVYRLALPQ
jgi:hypothetical protein